MTAKKKFPQFSALNAPELARLLKRSMLSAEDRQIAVSVLRWDMDYIDVGAKVNMDRRTVSRHMHEIIAPELERLMRTTNKKCAGV